MQLDYNVSILFKRNSNIFVQKLIRKYRLENDDHFVSATLLKEIYSKMSFAMGRHIGSGLILR